MFTVILVNDNGLGWKETFREKSEAIDYANEWRSNGFYVYITEHNIVPRSFHYAGD